METTTPSPLSAKSNFKEEWFDKLVSLIRSHELQIASGVASKDIVDLYKTFFEKDAYGLATFQKKQATRILVGTIVLEYAEELRKIGKLPLVLAIDHNDSAVFVWALIEEDDEDMEDALLLLEARINARHAETGFQITSMIVEVSDGLSVPNHYTQLLPSQQHGKA